VVPGADLERVVAELASTIAGNAPLTVKAAKACVRETFVDPERRDLARLAEMVETCFLSRDYQEGRRAFMEKRPPEFEGR